MNSASPLATQPVLEHLARSFRGNAATLELARALLNTELDCVLTQSEVTSLRDELQVVAASGEASRARSRQLEEKFAQIQDFSRSVECKQNLIQVLVKHNRGARSRLVSQQQRLVEYMQRSVSVYEPEVRSHASELQSATDAEVDAFKRLPLPFLVRMRDDMNDDVMTTLPELSIRRCAAEGGGEIRSAHLLRELRQTLDCPSFLAAECVPQQVWLLHAELCTHALAQRASDVTALSSSDRNVTHERSQALARHLTSLCEQAREVDAEHERELLPVLKERIGRATQALGECAGVNEAMRLWWEQPAQDVTPWRKVDGRSFQQWKDKFVVIMTRLRQQELVRK